jgi:hypothetical protein
MLPAPIEHTFALEGERYRLVEWDRGGERRIKVDYALAISPAPSVLESIDGANLYVEAVARECLREAPDLFWEMRPAAASQNGTPSRVVTLEKIPRQLWEQFRKEVDAFIALIFPAAPPSLEPASPASAGESLAVAAAQALSPVLRGRAE